jgi:NAD(P)-dependent dehydrogenase (short-subunit alcohol dehydrogenase family)
MLEIRVMSYTQFDLNGKTAMVTGAAAGLGMACALGLAEAGADVAVVDIQDELGEQVAAKIRKLGREAFYLHCDVTHQDQVAATVKEIHARFGRLDIAHNNAGGGVGGLKSADEGAPELFRQVVELDLLSVFYCCHEQAKVMIPQGGGLIINTASAAGTSVPNISYELLPMGVGMAGYCAAKAGVKQLTKALATEWAEHNIRVNSISPGFITTSTTTFILDYPELLEQENSLTPMQRQGLAEEMVGGVIYLASDASSFTTGHDLVMDGGFTAW